MIELLPPISEGSLGIFIESQGPPKKNASIIPDVMLNKLEDNAINNIYTSNYGRFMTSKEDFPCSLRTIQSTPSPSIPIFYPLTFATSI